MIDPDLSKHQNLVIVDVPEWIDITDWDAYSAWLEGIFKTEEEYGDWKRKRLNQS